MSGSHGPLPRVFAPLSYVAARLYGIGHAWDVARVRRKGAVRLDVPVISIGNMTVGGTGKTPVCARLATALQEAGARPAIALRGYRASKTGGSDEAAEYSERLLDIPILVGADRAATARRVLAEDPNSFNVLLLDDGFQHRGLHRDLDIVLIDSTRPGLDGDMVPHGWLREPAHAIKRADLVLVTRSTEDEDAVDRLVERFRGTPPEATCSHAWELIDVFEQGTLVRTEPSTSAPIARVAVATGLGNPAPLIEQVRATGMEVTEHLSYRDHVDYDAGRIREVMEASKRAGGLLVSAKDWVKLRRSPVITDLEIPILVPRIRVEFTRGAAVLADRLQEACGYAPAL